MVAEAAEVNSMTPMFQQYFDIKKQYPNAILFFRLGDFYEMFFEDAEIASSELGIALTSRDTHKKDGKKANMCGVPHHSASTYIARLVKKGYNVAICEQMENPSQTKTIVRREVVRVITPGTVLDESLLDETRNNFITSIHVGKTGLGIATCDITTGEFFVSSYKEQEDRALIDEVARISPAEIVVKEATNISDTIQNIFDLKPTVFLPWAFEYINAYKTTCDHFNTKNLKGFGIEDDDNSIIAAGSLLEYLNQTQMTSLSHIATLKKHTKDNVMSIDISSRNNLELVKTQRGGDKKGSLLWVLDKTVSPLGARLIRKWIEEPLINLTQINERGDSVEEFFNEHILRDELRSKLRNVKDIERLLSKVTYKTATPQDLFVFKSTLAILPDIKNSISGLTTSLNKHIHSNFDTLNAVYELIEHNIAEDGDGLIKQGVNNELDQYKTAKTKGVDWLLEIEENERNATGIKNLKIKFSKVFGYCIEVTNASKHLVPEHYVRRQTLTNAERYITENLKEIEEKILSAEEKIKEIENKLYTTILNAIAEDAKNIIATASKLATLDVLLSLAEVAHKNNYVRPLVKATGSIDIENGRHPVVEQLSAQAFIANDTNLTDADRIYIITGPNMAGKSTYMRGVALIVLMAHVGSFVPASRAAISVVDRIFTRVGASDDLATGQSTFMVEMNEVANILNNATRNSLVILDEIGRGTSTYDGLCIAWAVIEHISLTIGAKTLFATHYHELTQIEGKIEGIKNCCVPVEEINGELVFLRKVMPGSVDKSYGIQVAMLSGIPQVVTTRANNLMAKLKHVDIVKEGDQKSEEVYFR